MQISDTVKYFIHANLHADGVVERSDVVGAIFGQTEGLLGDELDLRDLQKASKVSRMEVEVESEGGESYGRVTIGSSLDKVETSVLAAALETIERVGPCTAEFEVESIEDVRTAKRKEVVDKAKRILDERFDDSSMTTEEILDEVRDTVRKGEIESFAGLPAGPNVEKSDAILVVEGRADVLNLLKHGIKNAVGVEGTNIPDEVAELTRHKTVTAFLDSDRGGSLILKELAQVGEIDYVAQTPEGRCVEDLSQKEITKALRDKMPYEVVVSEEAEKEKDATVEPGTADSPLGQESARGVDETEDEDGVSRAEATGSETQNLAEGDDAEVDVGSGATSNGGVVTEQEDDEVSVHDIGSVDDGEAVLLTSDNREVSRTDTDSFKEEIASRNGEVETVVLGGDIDQRALDIASRHGVETLVGEGMGYVAKKPMNVKTVTRTES
ncbi:MAG: DNA primase DnaG [Halobacteria archaeon]|nr:DNA primase DnaG [Halobacteria archaeon]